MPISEAQDALGIMDDRPLPGRRPEWIRNGQKKPASAGFLLSGPRLGMHAPAHRVARHAAFVDRVTRHLKEDDLLFKGTPAQLIATCNAVEVHAELVEEATPA